MFTQISHEHSKNQGRIHVQRYILQAFPITSSMQNSSSGKMLNLTYI